VTICDDVRQSTLILATLQSFQVKRAVVCSSSRKVIGRSIPTCLDRRMTADAEAEIRMEFRQPPTVVPLMGFANATLDAGKPGRAWVSPLGEV
jgi:hypothetical protein